MACETARSLGLEATSELLVGYPAGQIALVADDRDVDLIVVGSRRLSAVKRKMLGRARAQGCSVTHACARS